MKQARGQRPSACADAALRGRAWSGAGRRRSACHGSGHSAIRVPGEIRVRCGRARWHGGCFSNRSMTTGERWLLIVDRKRRDLYEFLRREFEGRATVVLDRRTTARPRRSAPERRRGLEVLEAAVWQDEGYCVITEAGATASERQAARIVVRRAISRFSESRLTARPVTAASPPRGAGTSGSSPSRSWAAGRKPRGGAP
jgi:hypothetical protein